MPEIIIFVKAFSHLSSAWLININYFKACLCFDYSYRYFFNFRKFYHNFLDKFFIGLLNNFRFLLLFFLFLWTIKSLNERLCRNNFHQFEGKNSYFVGLNVLFNHSGKFYNFIAVFLFLVFDLSCNF